MGEILPADAYIVEEPEAASGFSLTQYIDSCGEEVLYLQEVLRTGNYWPPLNATVTRQQLEITIQEFAELYSLDPDTTTWATYQGILLKYQLEVNALFPSLD